MRTHAFLLPSGGNTLLFTFSSPRIATHTFSLCTLTFLAFSLFFNMWPPLFKQNQHKPCLDITSPTRTHLNTGQIMSFNHQPFFFFFWQKFQPLATVSYFKHFTSLFWCFPFIYVHKGKKVPSYWNLSASIVLLLRFFFLVSNFPLVIGVDYFHLINYTRFGIRFELH